MRKKDLKNRFLFKKKKKNSTGLPWRLMDRNLPANARVPRSRKTPHATEQLSLWAPTSEPSSSRPRELQLVKPELLEPVLCNKRSCHQEEPPRPACSNEEPGQPSPQKRYKRTYLQNINRIRGVKKTSSYWAGEVEKLGDWEGHIYTILYKTGN